MCCAALTCAGCVPTDMPAYSSDGKLIALSLKQSSGLELWTYDVTAKKARFHPMPDKWEFMSAQWLGSRLCVVCSRNVSEPKADKADTAASRPAHKTASRVEYLFAEFDLQRNRFLGASIKLHEALGLNPWKLGPFVAGFDQEHFLYVPRQKGEPSLYSIRDLKKVKKTARPGHRPAGRGWSVRVSSDEDGREHEVEVFDKTGKKTCKIVHQALSRAAYRGGREPRYARVSRDGKVLLLAFTTETIFRNHPYKYTFGVFETKTGELLWTGSSDSMVGTPIVKEDEFWTIEMVGRKVYTGDKAFNLGGRIPDAPLTRFVMARHFPNEKKPISLINMRVEVITHDLGEGSVVSQFAPSPDESQFLLAVSGKKPRLMFIPVRKKVAEKDIVTVELKKEK